MSLPSDIVGHGYNLGAEFVSILGQNDCSLGAFGIILGPLSCLSHGPCWPLEDVNRSLSFFLF